MREARTKAWEGPGTDGPLHGPSVRASVWLPTSVETPVPQPLQITEELEGACKTLSQCSDFEVEASGGRNGAHLVAEAGLSTPPESLVEMLTCLVQKVPPQSDPLTFSPVFTSIPDVS